MRCDRFLKASLVFVALCVAVSCGRKDDDDDDEETSGTLPSIAFSVPAAAKGDEVAALTAASGSNVLSEWGKRMDNVVTYINTMLEKINGSEALQKLGKVTFKTATGDTVFVNIEAAANTAYSKQSTVCVNGSPSLFLEWTEDSSMVHGVRDFGVDAWAATPASYKVEVVYTNSSPKVLQLWTYGTPWSQHIPTDVAAHAEGGTFLGEYIYATRGADSAFTMIGVNAWEKTVRAAGSTDAFTGDAYLSGSLVAAGSGSFVAWRVFPTYCSTIAFSQANTAAPGWCFGATVAASGAPTLAQHATLWTDDQLRPLGIASDTNVKVVTFPAAAVCQ